MKGLWFFKKEAKGLRGLPDIIICYKGRFICWELKRSEKEAMKLTGRIVLQRHMLEKAIKAGAIAEFVYPENLEYQLYRITHEDISM